MVETYDAYVGGGAQARTLNRRRYKNPRPHKREEEGRGIRHPGDYT